MTQKMTCCTTSRNGEEAKPEAIVQWKAHIMRSVNQGCAKRDIIAKLGQTSCLLVRLGHEVSAAAL